MFCILCVTHLKDARSAYYQAFFAETDKEAKLKAYASEKLPFYLNKFENILIKAGGKHFVAKMFTLVDLAMFDFVEEVDEITNSLQAYPTLQALREAVKARPNIAKYLASGRRTPNF